MTDRCQWHRVEDVLPDLDQIVFLWDGQRAWVGARVFSSDADGWVWADTYGDCWWNRQHQAWCGDLLDDDAVPTHWCPFPVPPTTGST